MDAGIEGHVANLERLGRSPKTTYTYRAYARTVIGPESGAKSVRPLTARDLDALYSRMDSRGARAGPAPTPTRCRPERAPPALAQRGATGGRDGRQMHLPCDRGSSQSGRSARSARAIAERRAEAVDGRHEQ